MLNKESSLRDFQDLNKTLYLVINDRYYLATDLFACMHRNITHVIKAIRKEKYDEKLEYRLCMTLSWSLALTNRFHIDLAQELWKNFPGSCPYCSFAPCACRERAPERQQVPRRLRNEPPVSLAQWQQMFAGIYINPLEVSKTHLSEEAGEVDEVIRIHFAKRNEQWFWKLVEELVDLVTNIFGVANSLEIDLAELMASYFANGDCPKCHQSPCSCEYIILDEPAFSAKYPPKNPAANI